MKTDIVIKEITQGDLVNLFSTALYNSDHFEGWYEHLTTDIEREDGDCYEDIMAKILLNHGRICVTDRIAEDGEVYGSLTCEVKENEDYDDVLNTTYFLTLDDVVRGLERAANGTFNAGENGEFTPTWREDNILCAQKSFLSFAYDDRYWDAVRADILMQIILFDEIVYG